MKVLITGAGGFLGAYVARQVRRLGGVPVLGLRDAGKPLRWPELLEFDRVNLDTTNRAQIHQVLSHCRPEAVVNCATYGVVPGQGDIGRTFAVNIAALERLIPAAADTGVQRFVQLGSCFEYGDCPEDIDEEQTLRPSGLYAFSKAAASRLALTLGQLHGVPVTVLRLFSLWGAGEHQDRLTPQIVRAGRLRQPLALTAGEQVRDYLHAEDAAHCITALTLEERFPEREIVNIGSGRGQSLRAFVQSIAAVCGASEYLRFGQLHYREGEMFRLVADTRRLESILTLPSFDQERFEARVAAYDR